jgi:hypothetical protein
MSLKLNGVRDSATTGDYSGLWHPHAANVFKLSLYFSTHLRDLDDGQVA